MMDDREIITLFGESLDSIRELPEAEFNETMKVMAVTSMETVRVIYGEAWFVEFVGAMLEMVPTAEDPAAIIVRKEELLQPKH